MRNHRGYGVVTMHRPSIVDDRETLAGIAGALREIAAKLPLVFPVHPRTRGNLDKFGLDRGPNVILTKPLSYMDFPNLWKDASLILTDSGGLQEETTAPGHDRRRRSGDDRRRGRRGAGGQGQERATAAVPGRQGGRTDRGGAGGAALSPGLTNAYARNGS